MWGTDSGVFVRTIWQKPPDYRREQYCDSIAHIAVKQIFFIERPPDMSCRSTWTLLPNLGCLKATCSWCFRFKVPRMGCAVCRPPSALSDLPYGLRSCHTTGVHASSIPPPCFSSQSARTLFPDAQFSGIGTSLHAANPTAVCNPFCFMFENVQYRVTLPSKPWRRLETTPARRSLETRGRLEARRTTSGREASFVVVSI